MPNVKSAKKRLLTNEKARLRNKAKRSALRTFEKKLRSAVESKETVLANELFKQVSAKLDKAVKTGVIHLNKASRKKSRLAKMLNGVVVED